MKKNLSPYVVFILALIISACATVVAPDGGPRDTTPPIPEFFMPPYGANDVKDKKITVLFDEFIVLDKLTQQMVVSPPMPENPVVRVQGKKLIIELPDSLRDNTTYTIFFGNAVVNYKENIPVRNFSYVFSTGEVVDSLQLKGSVVKAFDLQPYEEIYVMLYKSKDDSVFYKEKPYYLARPDNRGSFKLNNLASGEYQIYALKDANRNYIYDQPIEEIAFLDSLVIPYYPVSAVPDSTDSLGVPAPKNPEDLHLFLFSEEPEISQLISHKVINPKKLQFIFNRSIDDFRLIPLDFEPKDNWHFDTYALERDSIHSFLFGIDKDTINVAVADGDEVLDSLRLVLMKKKTYAKKSKKKVETKDVKPKSAPIPKISFSDNLSTSFPFFSDVSIKFEIPLKEYSTDKIELYKAKDTVWLPIDFQVWLYDSINHQQIKIRAKLQERERYKLLIRDSCFFDLYGATNDSIEKEFNTTEMRLYGSLLLKVELEEGAPLLIQLLNSKDMVVQQHILQSSGQISYPYLSDGKYKIKAIRDKNANGKWDTGDLQKRIQPEEVYFIPKIIDVRANWDNEQVWIIED